ncbi:unnamed protein product [Phytomonas sp. EM1]|nr:unnamed protein product [Phytomonas sp. EM1]|eukprot:CCW60861.1 unnamed protein product [Phytomonas sp. isolate EM1]
MSGQESLRNAMRDALEADGTISHIKAELRAAVFRKLSGNTGLDVGSKEGDMGAIRPPDPPENLIINELIKEYLVFNGLEHTLGVFQLEAQVPVSQVPRKVLAVELNLGSAPTSIPLLYSMLHELRLSHDMSQ